VTADVGSDAATLDVNCGEGTVDEIVSTGTVHCVLDPAVGRTGSLEAGC
jgi:hypothetical protein